MVASNTQVMRNALKATVRIGWGAARGQKVRVSEQVQSERLEICRRCKWLDADKMRCNLCGCRMKGIMGKTAWATESCPASPPKWHKVRGGEG